MKEEPPRIRFCLYDAAALAGVVERMAAQAAGLLAGADDPVLLGILRRGAPLAEMLQRRLQEKFGLVLPRYDLKLERYADDLTVLHPDTQLTENAAFAKRDLSRATLLVVDDVLYQGHSLARLLAYLEQRHAALIHAAVLVDRCYAALPVRADIVGLSLQVAPDDVVECHVPPYEDDFRIDILRLDGA